MNNARNKKHGDNRAPSSIIDGFIRRSPQAPGGTPFEPRKHQQAVASSIDDFKRPDGFAPRNRSTNAQLPDGTGLGRKSLHHHESTIAKKRAHKKRPHVFKRVLKKSSSTLLMAMVIGAGFLLGTVYLSTSTIFQGGNSALALNDDLDPSLLNGEGDGRVNILLLGRGGEGHTAPDLTDTIMIASIDPIQKDTGLLSIPRDLFVQTPGNGSMKVNSVYATAKQYAISQGKSEKAAEAAGVDAIEKTVEEVAGIPINYHVMIDFRGFEKAINIVDGVDINVKTPIYENMVIRGKPYVLDVPVGPQHLSGMRALAYSRSRLTSARGDFDRSERQRQILVALRQKVFSIGTFGNPVKITQLINAFGKHVQTNLTIGDVQTLYGLAGQIDDSKVKSISLVDPPHVLLATGMYGGLSIVQPVAGLNVYTDIHSFVRRSFKDGFIRKEDPKILVLNGTNTPGLADAQKKILKSYGYKVIGVGDAPTKNYAKTMFVDLRHGEKKYTKRYMELRYKTTATDNLPKGIDPGEADFVIIVGNETNTL